MTPPARADRQHDTGPIKPSRDDIRSPFRHDRDRILYSPEFRRLSGITQVISPLGHHVTHNRLTHTLEVAQIARAIAEVLARRHADDGLIEVAGGLDADVVEAAALAHDIGHPPFGHVAEGALNAKLKGKGGFEGNAQSFRILTQISVHDTIYPGLNLTRATMSAVTKYPWSEAKAPIGARKKWGFYDDQQSEFEFSRGHLPGTWKIPANQTDRFRTLEAEIMDWADDVAYAIHDLEDFFKAGMIPLDKLKSSELARRHFVEQRLQVDELAIPNRDLFESTAETLLGKNSLFEDPYRGDHLARAYLQRFSSGKIGYLISEPRLVGSSEQRGWNLEIGITARIEVALLKGLLEHYVIDSPSLLSARLGYQRMVSNLFDILVETNDDYDPDDLRPGERIYPRYLQERVLDDRSDSNVYRTAADFITSLTEPQVAALYRRLTGTTIGDPLDKIVH